MEWHSVDFLNEVDSLMNSNYVTRARTCAALPGRLSLGRNWSLEEGLIYEIKLKLLRKSKSRGEIHVTHQG